MKKSELQKVLNDFVVWVFKKELEANQEYIDKIFNQMVDRQRLSINKPYVFK